VASKVKEFLAARQQAYQWVFNEEDQFAKAVLKDLALFCRENKSCFHVDSRMHAVLEGRREVMLRIREHCNLDFKELWAIYGGNNGPNDT
jgi:hypothetical protein